MDENTTPQNETAEPVGPEDTASQPHNAGSSATEETQIIEPAVLSAVQGQDSLAQDDAEYEIPKSAAPDNPLRVLEALLFASDEILTTDRIKTIVPGQPDARKIRHMVDTINVQFARERHPFEVVEIGGGYQLRTVSYYYPWVVQLFKEKTAKKLSIQSLECLAIISYKQPITKAEIEQIRGVLSDGAMKTLLEKRLVTISGRSDKPGRPLLYSTTKDFLAYFGINKIADLPRIEEFEAMAKEKLGELTELELQGFESEKTQSQEALAAQTAGADTVPAQNAPGREPQLAGSDDSPPAAPHTEVAAKSGEDTVGMDPA
jgi:segregation and condensation protein B